MAQHGYGVSRESHAKRGIAGPGLKLRSDGYDSKRHPVHDPGRGQWPRASSTVIVSSLYLRGTARPPKYGVATKGYYHSEACQQSTLPTTSHIIRPTTKNTGQHTFKPICPTPRPHQSHSNPTPIPPQSQPRALTPHRSAPPASMPRQSPSIPSPRANPASKHAP